MSPQAKRTGQREAVARKRNVVAEISGMGKALVGMGPGIVVSM